MKSFKILFALALMVATFCGCKKNAPAGNTNYTVRMTDAPGNFTAVNIDLRSVVVTGQAGGDVTLNTIPGVYNLLNFSAGIDTMIAYGSLQAGNVSQVRLILGPNNSVVVDGQTYPLSTPSAEQSGLKLQVHQTLQAGVSYGVLLDFDANQSIVQEGNGTYKLKPVIRTVETALNGSIMGSVNLLVPGIIVTATGNGTSYSSVTQPNGHFLLPGLAAGTYSVTISPSFPAPPVTVGNVVVTVGASTNMGVITL